MDVNDPASSLHRAQFLPLLPLEGSKPRGINPFLPDLALDYEDYLKKSTNRSALISRRRAKIKDILRNSRITFTELSIPDRVKRKRLNNLKH
jgi:hypothetical protein